jgi:hypothetical protein
MPTDEITRNMIAEMKTGHWPKFVMEYDNDKLKIVSWKTLPFGNKYHHLL